MASAMQAIGTRLFLGVASTSCAGRPAKGRSHPHTHPPSKTLPPTRHPPSQPPRRRRPRVQHHPSTPGETTQKHGMCDVFRMWRLLRFRGSPRGCCRRCGIGDSNSICWFLKVGQTDIGSPWRDWDVEDVFASKCAGLLVSG